MENNIKAIFFDFDFTLFSHKTRRIPLDVIETLRELHTHGVKFILNTARSYYSVNGLRPFDLLPFDGVIALCGNSTFLGEKEIINEVFSKETFDKIVKICLDNDISYAFTTKYREYTHFISGDKAVDDYFWIYYDPVGIDEVLYDGSDVYQFKIFARPDKEYLFKEIMDECHFYRFLDCVFEFKTKVITKGESTKAVLDALGLKKEEAAAFGDSKNDIAMFESVGHGICLGNGTEDAKNAADYVTCDIDDNGVIDGLKHLKLI